MKGRYSCAFALLLNVQIHLETAVHADSGSLARSV
jgi:hypothetical protein